MNDNPANAAGDAAGGTSGGNGEVGGTGTGGNDASGGSAISDGGSGAKGSVGGTGGTDAVGGTGTAGTEPIAGSPALGGGAGVGGAGGGAGGVGGSTGGSAGAPNIVDPCASKSCGDSCTQCNTDDGSCYAGTCNFLADCTAKDPQCEPGAKRSCEPTDAEAASDPMSGPCDTVLGWGWDGTKCIAFVGCKCVGSECNSLLGDDFTCQSVYKFDSGCGS